MKHAKITIHGMHCASCETLLTDVLADTEGVAQAKVSKSASMAEVEYDPSKTDEKALRKAIESEGYKTA